MKNFSGKQYQQCTWDCIIREAFGFKGEDDYDGDIFSLVSTREPAPFWREKVIGVVILLRVLARMPISGNKLLVVKSLIILRSGEGQTSFNENNHANYCGEKIYNKAFQGVYFVGHKNFKVISRPHGRPCLPPRIYKRSLMLCQTVPWADCVHCLILKHLVRMPC